MNTPAATVVPSQFRYSLSELFRFMTVYAVVFAANPLTGLPASLLLVTFALALAARMGLLAAFLFMGALAVSGSADGSRELCTLLMGIAVLGWYRYERWRVDRAAATNYFKNARIAAFTSTGFSSGAM